MIQSGVGKVASKTHAHQAQSHSTQSAHGHGFMPMQALPPPSLPRSIPPYPPERKREDLPRSSLDDNAF